MHLNMVNGFKMSESNIQIMTVINYCLHFNVEVSVLVLTNQINLLFLNVTTCSVTCSENIQK